MLITRSLGASRAGCMLFQQMSVLDKLHAALAEEKRMEGLRAQAEAAVRPSLSPLAAPGANFCKTVDANLHEHMNDFVLNV